MLNLCEHQCACRIKKGLLPCSVKCLIRQLQRLRCALHMQVPHLFDRTCRSPSIWKMWWEKINAFMLLCLNVVDKFSPNKHPHMLGIGFCIWSNGAIFLMSWENLSSMVCFLIRGLGLTLPVRKKLEVVDKCVYRILGNLSGKISQNVHKIF